MFSTCCYCHAALGANDAIEHFPVGARLAFDGERGRLWAVCPRCARWNLAPIEERWEALEQCERAYRQARQRVSTDNIALARLKDGTDLVRIGRPLLPEFAAWRYGKQLRQRARRAMMFAVGTTGVGVAAKLAGASLPFLGPAIFFAWTASRRQPRVVVRETDGVLWGVSTTDLWEARIGLTEEHRLRVVIRERPVRTASLHNRLLLAPYGWDKSSALEPATRELSGDDALSLLQLALPTAHREGGSRRDVKAAAQHLEAEWIGRDEPAEMVIARWLTERSNGALVSFDPLRGVLFSNIPAPLRLASEMALQDADERRALAGELGELYARWEEAERIARIADRPLTEG